MPIAQHAAPVDPRHFGQARAEAETAQLAKAKLSEHGELNQGFMNDSGTFSFGNLNLCIRKLFRSIQQAANVSVTMTGVTPQPRLKHPDIIELTVSAVQSPEFAGNMVHYYLFVGLNHFSKFFGKERFIRTNR